MTKSLIFTSRRKIVKLQAAICILNRTPKITISFNNQHFKVTIDRYISEVTIIKIDYSYISAKRKIDIRIL